MKRIILTGGGTAGHVMPHLALIPVLQKQGWEIHYIGTENGIERSIIEPLNIPYHGISAGKLRRYRDPRNLTDPLKVIKGVAQAAALMRKLKPAVVFSKGGFVSVPVSYGAALCGVPVILHESDLSSGLANKLCIPFAKALCTTFPETAQEIGKKAVPSGTPMRPSLFEGDAQRAREIFGLNAGKPVLMITGGSLGAQALNEAVRGALDQLKDFEILHLCGKGNLDPALEGRSGYVQKEFLLNEMADAYALADVVLSRAGSNTIHELLALAKPNILVPYPATASRGDQIQNAQSFEKRGFSVVIDQKDLTVQTLTQAVQKVYENRAQYRSAMEQTPLKDGTGIVLEQIFKHAKV